MSGNLRVPLAVCAMLAAGCGTTKAWTNEYVDRSGVVRDIETHHVGSDGLDERHGLAEYRHENGAVLARGRFEHGVRSGRWHWWFADGTPWCEGEYVDGVESGEWLVSWPGGVERMRGTIEGGFPDGGWEFTRPDGSLCARGRLRRGVPNGPWLFLDERGRVAPRWELPDEGPGRRAWARLWWSLLGAVLEDWEVDVPFCAFPLGESSAWPVHVDAVTAAASDDCAWDPWEGEPGIFRLGRVSAGLLALERGALGTGDYQRNGRPEPLTDAEIEALKGL